MMGSRVDLVVVVVCWSEEGCAELQIMLRWLLFQQIVSLLEVTLCEFVAEEQGSATTCLLNILVVIHTPVTEGSSGNGLAWYCLSSFLFCFP